MRADRGHETADIKSRGIVIFLIALAALTVLVLIAMRGVFVALENRAAREERAAAGEARDAGGRRVARESQGAPDAQDARAAAEDLAEPPAGPLLQANPPLALAEMRAAEDAILSTYAWVNADVGVVRIPIDRAIELLAARGLPARASTAAYAYFGEAPVSGDFVPRDANSGRGAGAPR